ncbi:hypothetical protein QF002_007374 [Paraburkholderia youngii]
METDPDKLVEANAMLEPTLGGITSETLMHLPALAQLLHDVEALGLTPSDYLLYCASTCASVC